MRGAPTSSLFVNSFIIDIALHSDEQDAGGYAKLIG
jgi:hypothetical protein